MFSHSSSFALSSSVNKRLAFSCAPAMEMGITVISNAQKLSLKKASNLLYLWELLEGQEGQDECKHQDWSHVHELQMYMMYMMNMMFSPLTSWPCKHGQ